MAQITDGRIVEADPGAGQKLMQMGFGRRCDDGVQLQWLEAAFLLERGLLALGGERGPIKLDDLLKEEKGGAKKVSGAKKTKKSASTNKSGKTGLAPSRKDQYAIFRSLRLGGHVVRFSSGSPYQWRVHERGVGREQDRSQMLLYVLPPGWNTSVEGLQRQMAVARLLRLDLAIGFVQDGQAQIMKISKPPLEG